mmetsp:Transcript_18237/g.27906  ORF Transcript_18237/g.27906 Transcript_18237/m.27906 type:complete len:95 (-) Transcript_18237:40-324(-)
MKVNGGALVAIKKCEKYQKPLQRKKKIDLDAVGSQENNNLIDFLRCQCKAQKICADKEKAFSKCHSSVMGSGTYAGRKNCGPELEELFACTTGG